MQPIALIVEDNEVFRDIFAATLTREGWDVVTAVDGDDGLKKWVSAKWDLVVTDFDMPKTDGVALTSKIHAMEPDQKIFMISGSPWAEGDFLRAGGSAFFEKVDTKAWSAAVTAVLAAFRERFCDCVDCGDDPCEHNCDPESGLCQGCRESLDAEAEQRLQIDAAQGRR